MNETDEQQDQEILKECSDCGAPIIAEEAEDVEEICDECADASEDDEDDDEESSEFGEEDVVIVAPDEDDLWDFIYGEQE